MDQEDRWWYWDGDYWSPAEDYNESFSSGITEGRWFTCTVFANETNRDQIRDVVYMVASYAGGDRCQNLTITTTLTV